MEKKNISACFAGNEIVAALRVGCDLKIYRKNGEPQWDLWKGVGNYRDITSPVVDSISGRVLLMGSVGYLPMIRDLEGEGVEIIRSPFLKRGAVSGRAVKFKGKYLLPVVGVPYGCKLVSPSIFESENGVDGWRFKAFLGISEDVGAELRKLHVVEYKNRLVALIESSFPFALIFCSESEDGVHWSKPVLTNMEGRLIELLPCRESVCAVTETEDGVVLWRMERKDLWSIKIRRRLSEKEALDALVEGNKLLLLVASGQKISSVYIY